MTNRDVVFGFPDFSSQVLDRFPRFFEVVPRASDSLDAILRRGYPELEPVQKVILNLGILAGNSVMELITLAGNGFGLGAMKIGRTLLETAINAEYLRLMPAECDDYLDWHWIEQYKLLTYVRENMPDLLADLSDVAGTEMEFAKIRSRFQRPDGDLRGSWCRLDLGARAARVGFQESYKLINPIASRLIHGTIGGLAMHFGDSKDEVRIGTPPSLYFCEQALTGAHACLLCVIDTLSISLKTESSPPLVELVRDYEYAWSKSASAAHS